MKNVLHTLHGEQYMLLGLQHNQEAFRQVCQIVTALKRKSDSARVDTHQIKRLTVKIWRCRARMMQRLESRKHACVPYHSES